MVICKKLDLEKDQGKTNMIKYTNDYKDDLFERLQEDEYAAAYLNAALLDEDSKTFLIALKDVADARGSGLSNLAKKAHLNRENLYRTLSKNGNPRLNSLCVILEALGLHLAITPMKCKQRITKHKIRKPIPLKRKKKLTNASICKAIEEGRD